MADQSHGNIATASAADLNAAAKRYAASQSWAMKDGSYPIRPANMHGRDDLTKAIHAVGRGGADHDAIRKHVIVRAKAIGLSDLIPDNWNSDGSLRGSPMTDVERRFTLVPVETRKAEDGRRKISGYAAAFAKDSRNLGGFIETVDPTAFNQSRGDGWPDVICRYNHDDNMLLGTSAAGTLQLRTDRYGLEYVVEPPQSRSDIVELVERGDVRKSSFAFRSIEDDWSVDERGFPRRSLMSVQLVDTAPVNLPAYNDTSAGLRSLATRMGAPLEEVRRLADENELRKFFVRTDTESTRTPARKVFGPAAMATLLAKREDPYV